MKKGLVSIITPCYNTGNIIHRLLDSVLIQDYPSIAMLVIDDGSTDNSREVIESYIPRFNDRGYSLEYRYQENSGQSVAINNALKWVDGEYLVWPDSDDFYATTYAISSLVNILSSAPDSVCMVRALSWHLSEDTLEKLFEDLYPLYDIPENIFYDCLYCKRGFSFSPGQYMVKMQILDKCLCDREIFTEKIAGQNWQLLLPILYSYNCISISSHLFNIVDRKNSQSFGAYNTYDKKIAITQSYKRTILTTLFGMCENGIIDVMKLKEIEHRIETTYNYLLFKICVGYKKKDEAKKFLKMSKKSDISLFWYFKYLICDSSLFDYYLKIRS